MPNYRCRQCGADFANPNVARVPLFCSRACVGASQRKRPAEADCRWCKARFKVTPDNERYCSMACYDADRKSRTRHVCLACRKPFVRSHNWSARGKCLYCSVQCAGTAKQNKVRFDCARCGKGFDAIPSKSNRARYCSLACRWPDPPKPKPCLQCGREFKAKDRSRYCSKRCQFEGSRDSVDVTCMGCRSVFVVPRVREGTARYCSRRCFVRTRGETYIEQQTRLALDSLSIPYHQEWHVRGSHFVVDFFLSGHAIALEVDGLYWHSTPEQAERDRRKESLLASRGIRTVRIISREILGKPLAALASLVADRLKVAPAPPVRRPVQLALFGDIS